MRALRATKLLLFAIVVTVVIGLFALEFRHRRPQKRPELALSGRDVSLPCYRPSSWMNEHGFIPYCRGQSRIGPFSSEMTFNSEGIRDREYSAVPSEKVFRILLLGASNVVGLGIPEEKTLARVLEKDLSRLSGKKVEVINAATPAYCAWQTATKLQRRLERYQPDLVLFNYMLNSCPLFDSIWESRLVNSAEGQVAGFDRSLFGQGSVFSKMEASIFKNRKLHIFTHTIHEQLRRLGFIWKLSFSSTPEEDLGSSFQRAILYMDAASRAKGARFYAFIERGSHNLVNRNVTGAQLLEQFWPAVVDFETARFFSRFVPEVALDGQLFRKIVLEKNEKLFQLSGFDYSVHVLEGDNHLSAEGHRNWSAALAPEVMRLTGLKKERRPDPASR